MMADFFDNLLVRSLTGPSPELILRPRLPSLFEPPYEADANLMPMANPMAQPSFSGTDQVSTVIAPRSDLSINHMDPSEESAGNGASGPTSERSDATLLDGKFPTTPSTIAVEPGMDQLAIGHVEGPRSPLPHRQETTQSAVQPIQPAKPPTNTPLARSVSLSNEPGSTILPRGESQAAEGLPLSIPENWRSTSKEQAQPPHQEPVSLTPQKEAEEKPPLNEHGSTLVPHAESQATQKILVSIPENRGSASREQGQLLRLQLAPVYLQHEAGKSQPPAEGVKNPPQAKISLKKEKSPVEEAARPSAEAFPARTSLKQSTVLQPILNESPPAGIQQFQQTKGQGTERVVEIHIGRIEVRAVPASTSKKQPPRSATALSLEDYLRSRSGGK